MPTSGISTVTDSTPRQRLQATIEQAATALEPVITNLDDGCVRVCVGDVCGTVSSHHLIDPKVNQLRTVPQ